MSSESAPGSPSRRAVLRGGLLAVAGTPAAASLLAACGAGYATDPDPLLPLLRAARDDVAAAATLRDSGTAVEAARAVVRVRGRHAEVLRAEIDRLNRPRPDETRTPRTPGAGDLADRLARARDTAAALVPNLPAYRAGLVGSVAAGCAGLRQLAPELGSDGRPHTTGVAVRAQSPDELESEATSALHAALRAEEAAVWIYGLVTAYLPGAFTAALQRGRAAHRATADATRGLLTSAGAEPNPPQPAYVPAKPVTDEDSALRVVVTAEEDAARTWRGVLVRTDDTALRTTGTRALVRSAARATRWRAAAGTEPAARALPGAP